MNIRPISTILSIISKQHGFELNSKCIGWPVWLRKFIIFLWLFFFIDKFGRQFFFSFFQTVFGRKNNQIKSFLSILIRSFCYMWELGTFRTYLKVIVSELYNAIRFSLINPNVLRLLKLREYIHTILMHKTIDWKVLWSRF